MQKFYSLYKCSVTVLFAFVAVLVASGSRSLYAQATISTTSSYTANNGYGLVTFNFQNSNNTPVTITNISSVVSTMAPNTFKLWYKSTPINGAPGTISTSNGWTQVATNTFSSTIGSTTNTTAEPVLSGILLVIPANTTYGLCVSGFLVSGTSTSGTQRYYTITSTAPTTFSGGGCSLISGTGVGYAGTIEADPPTFTPRGFTGSVTFVNGALPVVLKDFIVSRQNDDATIAWTTLTESNTRNFTVQRSTDGTRFTSAGEVAAKGSAATYTLRDTSISRYATGDMLYYRLLTTDYDGKTQMSKVVALRMVQKPGTVWVYPNPFKDRVMVQVSSEVATRVILTITTEGGMQVSKKEQVIAPGNTVLQMDGLQHLSAGIYIITVTTGNTTRTYKLVR